jgi:glutathione peroxidase
MTIRQRILKWIYPVFMGYKRAVGKSKKIGQAKIITPPFSFYHLSAILNNGAELSFEDLKDKKVLIVNTASNCGYTNQYEGLQKLFDSRKEKLIIIAFPSNDFKEQEKGNDEEIARFCQVNFGITFPLAKKSVVVKTKDQNKVFHWLTHKEMNGWNEQQPTWNFSKYLVNNEGILTHYFDPAISPLDREFIKAIDE